MPNYKKDASTAMSRYIRLRDALEYCDEYNIDPRQFSRPEEIIGKCCTCGKVARWGGSPIIMNAGHWKTRGAGGGSGVYFDERNVHLQCVRCNKWDGGRELEHGLYIIDKYGQDVFDELILKHHIPLDAKDGTMQAMKIYYDQEYQELIEANGL